MAKTASKSKIGDAILPQNATKLTKTCGSEFGGPLWRHLTPQRKTAIWVQVLPVHNSQKCMTFGAHKLVRSEPFLDYLYKL